jgi:hypothetical protein
MFICCLVKYYTVQCTQNVLYIHCTVPTHSEAFSPSGIQIINSIHSLNTIPFLGLVEAVMTSSEATVLAALPWVWPRPPTGDWKYPRIGVVQRGRMGGGGITCLVATQEAKYVESWPSTTSA